jgi:hypothetical protein
MALNEEYTPFHTIVINDTEQKRPNTQNRLIFAMGSATLAAMLVYVSMPLQPTPSALWNAPAHVMRANPTTHVVTQQRVNAASLPSTRPSALGPLSPVSVPDMHTMHDVERSIVHPQPPSSFGSWPMWAMLFPAIASVAFVLGRWGAGQKYQWAMAAMDGESPRNRVFVQGLPPSVTWRELKDHFRIAGNVVYGNVTTDRDTGISKGFGVVEYETHEEAQYAIEIMQDHPLEGSVLNVREDRDRGSNRGWNNRPWTPQRNVEWARARDDPTADGSEEDAARAEAVYEALVERDGHRSSRWFDEADRIRDELWEQGIGVDDQRKIWWVQSAGGPQGDQWQRAATDPTADGSAEDQEFEAEINQKLAERESFRANQDYESADAIQAELWEIGINLDKRQHIWYKGSPGGKGKGKGKGRALQPWAPESAEGLEPDFIEGIVKLLTVRDEYRRQQDYEQADEIRDQLKAQGVFVNDRSRMWRFPKGNAPVAEEAVVEGAVAEEAEASVAEESAAEEIVAEDAVDEEAVAEEAVAEEVVAAETTVEEAVAEEGQ